MTEQELILRGAISMLSEEEQKKVFILRDGLLDSIRGIIETDKEQGTMAVSLAICEIGREWNASLQAAVTQNSD